MNIQKLSRVKLYDERGGYVQEDEIEPYDNGNSSYQDLNSYNQF